MDIGINDLDFEDQNPKEEQSIEEQQFGAENNFTKKWMGDNTNHETDNSELLTNNDSQYNNEDDVITNLLKAKGIEDPNQIKFEDDDGNLQSRPWSELTKEEQFNILNGTPSAEQDDLDDDEISLINLLRLSRMTPDEFVLKVALDGAQQFASSIPQERNYAVDDISDDELFMYDLKARAENITDEEVVEALQQAKENPNLYLKQVEGIRTEYKKLEEDQEAQNLAEEQQRYMELQQVFQNNILQAIDSMDSIGSLDVSLDDEDKEEVAQFILGQDLAGNSYLGKALNDPETLTRMAWFALRGADALDEILDYFSKLITEARRLAYTKGVEDERNGKPHVVIQKTNTEKPISAFNKTDYKSINDLD